MTVAGVQRRVPANIFGCSYGMGIAGGASMIDHPPLLPPGQSTSFRYVLKDYDLKPGKYDLTAAGKAGVQWKYYPFIGAPNSPPPPPPRHQETDPVDGAEFDRTLTFTVAAATEDELRAVLLRCWLPPTDPIRSHVTRHAPPSSRAHHRSWYR